MRNQLAVALLLLLAISARAAEKLTIEFRPQATVRDGQEIRLGDVAVIRGGSTEALERLAALDLDDPPRPGTGVRISPAMVRIRLQLAGWAASQFELRGNGAEVTASRELPAAYAAPAGPELPPRTAESDDKIVAAARDCILRRLPFDPQNVELRFVSRGESKQADSRPTSSELRTPWPPLGFVTVAVKVDGQEVPVHFEVKHLDEVVLTKSAVNRGRPIVVGDLYVDRRSVNGLTNYFSDPASLVGKQVTRPIAPLQILRNFDVAEDAPTNPVVIRRASRVRLVARTATLAVDVEGESLQDGRLGELISFRNLKSGKTVVGRVTGPGEASVVF